MLNDLLTPEDIPWPEIFYSVKKMGDYWRNVPLQMIGDYMNGVITEDELQAYRAARDAEEAQRNRERGVAFSWPPGWNKDKEGSDGEHPETP